MPSFAKQPNEQYPIGYEFAGKIPASSSLSSAVVSAWDFTANVDVSGTVLQTTTGTITGTQALVRVQGGTGGHNYRITFRVTLNTGDILEEDVIMLVREI